MANKASDPWLIRAVIAALSLLFAAHPQIAAAAAAETLLHSFDGTDGAVPSAGLIQASDGSFYDTTFASGTNVLTGNGTVYRSTPAGVLTTLHAFDGVTALQPSGDIVFGPDGALFGKTQAGGTSGYGTVYKLAIHGAITALHSFVYTDGGVPVGGGGIKPLLILSYAGAVTPYFWADRRAWLALALPLMAVVWGATTILHMLSGMPSSASSEWGDVFSPGFGFYLSLLAAIVLAVGGIRRFSRGT